MSEYLASFLKKIGTKKELHVLDVGCGYGKNIEKLCSLGAKVLGVDKNPYLVKAVCEKGFAAKTVEEFEKSEESFDVILFSHIIEHFAPADLLQFMDSFIDRLKPGGYVIIATPLDWPDFFDDFDHIKPYPPEAIERMFCVPESQVQYHSRHELQRVQLIFRRHRLLLAKGQRLWLEAHFSLLERLIEKFFSLAYWLTGGLVGLTNGWMGLYQLHSGQKDS